MPLMRLFSDGLEHIPCRLAATLIVLQLEESFPQADWLTTIARLDWMLLVMAGDAQRVTCAARASP